MEKAPVAKLASIVPEFDELMKMYAFINPPYVPWSVFHQIIPADVDAKKLWYIAKLIRRQGAKRVGYTSETGAELHYNVTDTILRACHEFDLTFNAPACNEFDRYTADHGYDVLDRFAFEPAESVLLAGAAKEDDLEFLDRFDDDLEPLPVTPAETALANGMHMFDAAVTIKPEERLMQRGFMKKLADLALGEACAWRSTDDKKYSGRTVISQPRPFNIQNRLEVFCDWFNTKHDMHPLIRAAIIHFIVCYERPFADGNGRLGRALFYRVLVMSGYYGLDMLSLSASLSHHKADYDIAFCRSELNDFDLTYVISHICSAVLMEVKKVRAVRFELRGEVQAFEKLAGDVLATLTPQQRKVAYALIGRADGVTEDDVKAILGDGKTSPKTTLKALVAGGLVKQCEDKTWRIKALDGELQEALNG